MRTKTIKQIATFEASPAEVYDLIMNSEKHAEFTDAEAKMSTAIDGKFEVFDGYCHGYNIELKNGEKIVQAWHFDEVDWPENHFSICTFTFEAFNDKTKLIFEQTGIPIGNFESLKKGWKEYYWDPMKAYLKRENAISKN
jgi:activator of HSP90 ATPase